MGETAIRARGVGKQFRIGSSQSYGTLREALSLRRLLRRGADPQESLWALHDVSFDVHQGEAIGVVGHNGAGKSTLLKLLSRISEPTEGSIEIRGRVGSLLEVGTGFHPELTGRENVFLNGAILGMRRAETASKFDEIVEFAELRRFIDTPVKRYSSGMYMRLAFAVAAHLEPDILLVDEVLAVGDTAFQGKCLAHMRQLTKRGITVVFVSHNLLAMSDFCSRGLLLQKGKLVKDGPMRDVIAEYRRTAATHEILNASASDAISISALRFNGREAGQTLTARAREPARFQVELDVAKPLRDTVVNLVIELADGRYLVHVRSDTPGAPRDLAPGRHAVSVEVKDLALAPGTYSAFFRIVSMHPDTARMFDSQRLPLVVEGDWPLGGLVTLDHTFDFKRM